MSLGRFGFLSLSLVSCLALASAGAGCGDSSSSSGGGGSGTGAGGSGGEATSSGAGGEGAGVPGQQVTIVTWNLHNFFDTVEDASNEAVDSQSQAAYDAKLAAAVETIGDLDPDIMLVIEVENEGILEDMNAALGGVYTTLHLTEGNDPRGVDIGLMSKIPTTDIVSHLEDKFALEGTAGPTYSYSRDCPEYHFRIGDQNLVLLGVHYKAKGPPDNPEKRLAEAQHTRAIADFLVSQDESLAVAILGDFNDLPGSPPLDATIDGPPVFVDAATFAPEQDQWSFDFEGSLELIDHLVMNPTLDALLDPTSVAIPHTSAVEDASDHAPIVATFDFE